MHLCASMNMGLEQRNGVTTMERTERVILTNLCMIRNGTKVLVEENMELAKQYGIRQAPTMVILGGEEPEKLIGVGAVRKYIQSL